MSVVAKRYISTDSDPWDNHRTNVLTDFAATRTVHSTLTMSRIKNLGPLDHAVVAKRIPAMFAQGSLFVAAKSRRSTSYALDIAQHPPTRRANVRVHETEGVPGASELARSIAIKVLDAISAPESSPTNLDSVCAATSASGGIGITLRLGSREIYLDIDNDGECTLALLENYDAIEIVPLRSTECDTELIRYATSFLG